MDSLARDKSSSAISSSHTPPSSRRAMTHSMPWLMSTRLQSSASACERHSIPVVMDCMLVIGQRAKALTHRNQKPIPRERTFVMELELLCEQPIDNSEPMKVIQPNCRVQFTA